MVQPPFYRFGDLRCPQPLRQRRVSGLSYPLALALTLRALFVRRKGNGVKIKDRKAVTPCGFPLLSASVWLDCKSTDNYGSYRTCQVKTLNMTMT